jgi:putative ABC transport system substrate-binding protein
MRRRDCVALLAVPLILLYTAATAQKAGRTLRIGVIDPGTRDDIEVNERYVAFEQSLKGLGWNDGGNVRFEYRFAAGKLDHLPELARELAGLHPDLILAASTPATAAMLGETHSIPVVFTIVTDPVGSGFVQSLPRPGGNATGFTYLAGSVASKWLQLLKELSPQTAQVALIFNPETASGGGAFYLRPYEAAAKSAAATLAMKPITLPVHDADELGNHAARLSEQPLTGLIVIPQPFTYLHRELIVSFAEQHRLPAIYPWPSVAAIGGLICYGIDLGAAALMRQAASYVDRILRGAQPAELPVQEPTTYKLAINLRVAAALGLAPPPSLIARADEVIE